MSVGTVGRTGAVERGKQRVGVLEEGSELQEPTRPRVKWFYKSLLFVVDTGVVWTVGKT